MNVPQHIAIILDGNGRWAKAKGMPRNYGHAQGSKNVEKICEEAWRMGIKYLTVYAFSTENWSRPENEVAALMKLLRNYMKTCLKTAAKNDMKIRVIGDIEPLDDDIKSRIRELEAATTDNGGLNFTIALNYGSRDELTRAAQKMAKDCAEGKIKAEEIDESVFETYLDTHGIPDPDMMIRTSGEQRLSNYLLWQLAYSEFYFTDVPWPDSVSYTHLDVYKRQQVGRCRKSGQIPDHSASESDHKIASGQFCVKHCGVDFRKCVETFCRFSMREDERMTLVARKGIA